MGTYVNASVRGRALETLVHLMLAHTLRNPEIPEVWILGRARLSYGEHSGSSNCCLYGGAVGHYIGCPVEKPFSLVGSCTLVSQTGSPLIPITRTPFFCDTAMGRPIYVSPGAHSQ